MISKHYNNKEIETDQNDFCHMPRCVSNHDMFNNIVTMGSYLGIDDCIYLIGLVRTAKFIKAGMYCYKHYRAHMNKVIQPIKDLLLTKGVRYKF